MANDNMIGTSDEIVRAAELLEMAARTIREVTSGEATTESNGITQFLDMANILTDRMSGSGLGSPSASKRKIQATNLVLSLIGQMGEIIDNGLV